MDVSTLAVALGYTKKQVEQAKREGFRVQIEQDRNILETTGEEKIFYFLPKNPQKPKDGYDEFVYANNNWEQVGVTDVDLSSYGAALSIENGILSLLNANGDVLNSVDVSGSDGFSPTISTSSEYLRTRVEITDVNGMQYFYINDGESVKSAIIDANGDLKITIQGKPSGSSVHPTYPERIYNVGHVVGADGYSPTATVTQTQSGATVSITDKNGTTTANISNGADGSDYILTAQDKSDIADLVLSELPTTQGVQYGNAGN